MKIVWRLGIVLLYPLLIKVPPNTCSLSYTAAVVEYTPIYKSDEQVNIANLNTKHYIKIIEKAVEYSVDILIFPESSLSISNSKNLTVRRSEAASYIPDPQDKIVPCNDANNYPDSLKNISCAALKHKLYIVINHREKFDCVGDNCSDDGLLIYNTNVVFNRNGEVIARYRKYNLFGELDTNRTLEPIISTFETDFGVTFGQIICFDIMFKTPTLNLVHDLGIRDIIFSSHWYSEMPYLYSVQLQASWAFANDINLLSSGYNNPKTASGGSGIYIGRNGYVKIILENKRSNVLFVSEVPKVIDGKRLLNINAERVKIYNFSKSEISTTEPDVYEKYFHLIDDLNPYTTELINTESRLSSYEKTICDRNVCCELKLKFQFHKSTANKSSSNYYRYRAAVFNGTRTFSGFATGGVTVCGIISCINNTLRSCGKIFDQNVYADASTTFQSINISMKNIDSQNNIIMPISIAKNMLPLNVTDFTFQSVNLKNTTTYNMNLQNPRDDLLTFSIYGRNFDLDSLNKTGIDSK
ncbi:PREDICTED: vanin-like protein 1 [Ceratosolen solmsi marchali]|uniref:Vanin-like protein 1 n=1 Tax=Ceratosolen solmsi marchali TaxID=326594 RepID=A0AAJ6YNH7_9HYME|nr:PREDICTED: vanin-like protein 1 [Ceratosolen solmsi marchali]